MNQRIVAFVIAVTAVVCSLVGLGLATALVLCPMALWLIWQGHRLERTKRALRDSESRGRQVQQDLAAAKEAAEARDRSKSAFLATMSHEIRTPLDGVVGMASLLLKTNLTPEQRRSVEAIQECGDAMLTLTNDVLDLSKLEAGRLDIERHVFDLIELCGTVFNIVTPRTRAKDVTLVFSPSAELPAVVESDPARLRQVLLNLVGNAVKFTDSGSVELRVYPVGDDGARRIRFDVIDTGIGIPADTHERLFVAFSQVDASIARRYGGTGLGLAICKRIVTAMDGDIGVESEAGKGSTFWFELPLAARDPAPAPVAIPQHAAASLAILLAEDNAVNRRIAATILTSMGHTVDVAGNGRDAVAKATQRVYDVIIMDMQMPEMDGLTATRAIRALPGPAGQVPIMAMTANALSTDRDACLAAGMTDFVSKPITARKLFEAIAPWAGGASKAYGQEKGPANAGTAPPREPDVIDPERMWAIQQDIGSAALNELLIGFWADAGRLLQELELALNGADPARASAALRALKEAAAGLGLIGCSHACEAADTAIGEGRPPDLDPLMTMLFKMLQATQPRLLGASQTGEAA